MHGLHHVRAGEHQMLVAALQFGAAKILGGQVMALQGRACAPVKHQNGPLGAMESLQKSAGDVSAVGHGSHWQWT